MKTDKEIAEEVRKKFSYIDDKKTIEAIAQQSIKYYHEHITRQAKLKELTKLPTWEDDTVPHDSLAPKCMNCGRWTVAEDWNGQYGPTWYCLKCNKR